MHSEKELLIYEFLIDGITQSKIVEIFFKRKYKDRLLEEKEKKRIKKRIRQQVSYYTQKLEKYGFIKAISKHARPKVYQRTTATPVLSENATPVVSDKSKWDYELPHEIEVSYKNMKVHLLSYQYIVETRPKRDIRWDEIKENYANGGITQKYLYWPCKIGQITIRYDENKNSKDKVYIWVPAKNIPADQLENCERILQKYMWEASAWLQRVLLCRLGLPEVFNKPHYEADIREPFIYNFAQNNNIKVDDVHIDSSPPENEPKIESTDKEKVLIYMTLPGRMQALERHIKVIMEAISKLAETQEKMMESNQKFMESMEELMGFKKKFEKEREDESQQKMFG